MAVTLQAGGLARRKVSTYTGQLKNSEDADIENNHYVRAIQTHDLSGKVCQTVGYKTHTSLPL
jgi:hypothetical protein